MVTQVTGLSRNGVADWIVQRVTAVLLATYTVVLLGFVLINGDMDYTTWSGFFQTTWMQVFTLMTLLATCAHAWIGMWTVGSDYLQEHTLGSGATALRFIYQIGSVLILIAYLLWGVMILWGN